MHETVKSEFWKPDLFHLSILMKEHCVVYRWRMLNRLITSIYEEALKPLDLTPSQLNILAILAGMGEGTPRDLARSMQMDKSTVSRALVPLYRRELIESRPDPDDARGQKIHLTPQGEEVFRASFPLWQKAQEKACVTIGKTSSEVDEFIAEALAKSDIPGLGPIPEVPKEIMEVFRRRKDF
jgi:DNA-binding MarR family transcriptional regulator